MLPSGLKALLSQKRVQVPDEKPELFIKPKISPIGVPPGMKSIEKPQASSSLVPQQQFQLRATDDFIQRNGHHPFHDHNNNHHVANNNPFMIGHDVTLSNTMPTQLVNQMTNCSCSCPQQQQPKFRSNPFVEAPFNNQNFYEHNLKLQHQQQLQSMKRDFYNSSGMSTGHSSSSSSTLSAYEANMQPQYSMMSPSSSFFNRFDPPKPDTPPSKPLWLDPVWNCDGNFFDNRNAGTSSSGGFGNSDSVRFLCKLPQNSFIDFSPLQVKAFNFHVVSPFLSFKTMFTFDNMNPTGNANNHKM